MPVSPGISACGKTIFFLPANLPLTTAPYRERGLTPAKDRAKMRSSVLMAGFGGALVLSVGIGSDVARRGHKEAGAIKLFAADKINWQAGPPSLPKGAMIAVLEGDPAKEGLFVFRLKLP